MLDAFGRPQSIVVLGGTSDIAGAVVRRYAPTCQLVVLAGRDQSALELAAEHVRRAGADRTECVHFDAEDPSNPAAVVDACFALTGPVGVDLALVALGHLGREGSGLDAGETAAVVRATFSWPAVALARVGTLMARQGQGRIVVLSSVAGIRVRRANYSYGAAKAGLDAFSLGLAEELSGSGVEVLVVRPGFVRTKMTEGRRAAPLAIGVDRVATSVVSAVQRHRRVVWCPAALRWVFLVIHHLPAALWRWLAARAG